MALSVKLALSLVSFAVVAQLIAEPVPTPNIVLLFADDMGYGDAGCYGASGYQTPNLDRLAKEGARFTDFYVSSPVCSASRAALLTGCYHERIGISGALGPASRIGLNPDETTLAELCRAKGYATAAIGKWHLGRPEPFLPLQHGFDEYFGLPYSNDMWPHHPGVRHLPEEERRQRWPALPLIEGNRVVDEEITPDEQRHLTRTYSSRAVDFIQRHQSKPFFLYLAFSMPHVPLYVSPEGEGKSGAGLYGDVIREIDDSVGQILSALAAAGLDRKTMVLFTSDNGPWLSYGKHAGSAGGLREGKGTCWEGGIRVPFLARWPGMIPAGSTIREPAMTIDVLPTVAGLLRAQLPQGPLDGKDIWPLLAGAPDAKSPHDALFFYYQANELQAMRAGRWKLILPHRYRSFSGKIGRDDGLPVDYEPVEAGLELYDLAEDPGEKMDVASQHPEIVEELLAKVEGMRQDLGDRLTARKGSGIRPAGVLPAAPQP
jgi:arylsulfatase A-like enzyme